MKILGIVLVVIGLAITLYGGFGMVTKKKVADIGSIEITKEEKHTANWSPFVGVGIMVVGAIILVTNKKRAL